MQNGFYNMPENSWVMKLVEARQEYMILYAEVYYLTAGLYPSDDNSTKAFMRYATSHKDFMTWASKL